LVQDAAYGTLLRGRRQQLHARITGTLEHQFPEVVKARPEVLARHCTEAGLVEKAIGNWINAARESHARYALVETNLQARKGLALLHHLVDGPVRWRNELELQLILAWAEFELKGEGASEVWEASTRARTLCDQLEDRSHLADALNMQGIYYLARREYAAALRVAEDMLQLAREQNHTVREVNAHLIMG